MPQLTSQIKNLIEEKNIDYWLFQGNPKKFKKEENYELVDYFKRDEKLFWSVNQYRKKIKAGDKIYFWMCGEKSGLYFVGEVLSKPFMKNDVYGKCHVYFRVNEYYDKNYIPREKFVENEILKNSRNIKNPRGTNFPLTEKENEEIEKLIKNI